MTTPLLFGSMLIAAGALAAGYGLIGLWAWSIFFALIGGLWLLSLRRQWDQSDSISLFIFVVGAINGLAQGVAVGWLLAGLVAALSAWDLSYFARRLRIAEQIDRTQVLERRHIRRLLIVDGTGALLAGLALNLEIEFQFGIALILGGIVVLVLSQVVSFLRQGRRAQE